MTPPGYTLLRRGKVRVLVRHDVATRLGPWLLRPVMAPPNDAESIASGRGGAFRARGDGGLRLVVRPCRRGGWLGRVVTRTYLGWRPRMWREVEVSAGARARQVPTPAVLAARVEGWGLYRGFVVTEEALDTITLAEALRGGYDLPAQVRFARAAGEAVGRLHRAGVDHADLNLANILVARQGEGTAHILDLDRADLGEAPLTAAARRRNLRRLERSWHRLTEGAPVGAEIRAAFGAGYDAAGEASCGC